MKNIAVFGAFDTKGAEFTYLLECMRGLAPECKIITIDVSARTHDAEWAPDVSCEEVARMGGGDLQELAKGDRLEAVTVMIKGAKKCLRSLYDEGKLAGAITLGGGTGTSCPSGCPRFWFPPSPPARPPGGCGREVISW